MLPERKPICMIFLVAVDEYDTQVMCPSIKVYKSEKGRGVILVNMEISVILGHEKTKIRNIIDYGKIDVFSVRTIIHIKNKMMGHLIWPFGVLLYKTFQKWDVPRWRKAGWMIVVTCQTHFFWNMGTILTQ